jgi:hypothetical protein
MLAKDFSYVSLLDFQTDKFQLRGICPTKKTSLTRAPEKKFLKDFLFSPAGKLIPIADLEPACSRNIQECPSLICSPSPLTTLRYARRWRTEAGRTRAVPGFNSLATKTGYVCAKLPIVSREKRMATSLLRVKPNENCELFILALDQHQIVPLWTQRAFGGLGSARSSGAEPYPGLGSEHRCHRHRIQALLHRC